MFTDIVTVSKDKSTIVFHIFDTMSGKYSIKYSLQPDGCKEISNVAIGKGEKSLRILVTCYTASRKAILRMYDRNMNGELDQPSRILAKKDPLEDPLVDDNNIVSKQASSLKSFTFRKVEQTLNLQAGSEPFIGDLNGDFIDDILFNSEETGSKGRLKVAIFEREAGRYEVKNFKSQLVDPTCEGPKS